MAEEAPSKSLMEDAATYGATETSKKTWKPSFMSFSSFRDFRSPLSPPLLAECFGSFCLVLVVGCVVSGPAPATWAPTAIAALLMVMVYATGPISGGNLNPAVSLALAISGKLTWLQMSKYWASQLLGGFLGAAVYRCICSPNFVEVAPILPFGAGSCFSAEMIYSFMLAFVVLNCAARKEANEFFGLAIGFVIVAAGHAVGGVSGAALNPSLALALGITAWQEVHWSFLWCLAELLGAALAAGAFRLLRREELQQQQESEPTAEPKAETKPGLLITSAAELLGTFILVFTVGMNLVSKSPSTAFSAAAALMCMVYSLGDLSGAHLNPAVTLAMFLRGKCSRGAAGCYVLAQLFGGLFAGLFFAAFHGVSANSRKSIQLTMGKHYDIWQASFAELFFTMILAYVVLAVTATKNNYFGLAIGSCVTAGGCAAGSISGGEMNPAVCLGIYIANLVSPGHLGVGPFVNLLAFVVFELLGGALAAMLQAAEVSEKSSEKPKEEPAAEAAEA